jgi:hypothetical protein
MAVPNVKTTVKSIGVVEAPDNENESPTLFVVEVGSRFENAATFNGVSTFNGNATFNAASVFSGSINGRLSPVFLTGSYSIPSGSVNNYVYFVSASSTTTITLSSGSHGDHCYIKRIDGSGNTLTLSGAAGYLIDRQTTQPINTENTSVHVSFFAGGWWII